MIKLLKFENDVKMYGTQTKSRQKQQMIMFENDVKMYGTQTEKLEENRKKGLRMV